MNSVNLKMVRALVAALALAACVIPRRAPAVAPGEFRGLASRDPAATAGVPANASYRIEWRKGFGRGIVTPLQIHPPLLIATTTGRRVVTINAETGAKYWARRFSGPIAGSVLRRGDQIYVVTGNRENRITALALDRGKRIWASRRVGSFRVQPILLADRLIGVTDEGRTVAVAESDGAILWSTELRAPPAAQPVPDGSRVFVATVRDTLYSLDGADGRILARIPLPGTPSAPPILTGRTLVVPVQPHHVVTVDVDRMVVSPAVALPATVAAPPVAGDGGAVFLLARAGQVMRLDIASGAVAPVVDVGGATAGSFAGVGALLAIGRLDGTLFLVDRQGREVWQTDFDDSINAPVAALDGTMYVPLLRGDIVRLEMQ
jgi:outer membrane protein assembly factor BamB